MTIHPSDAPVGPDIVVPELVDVLEAIERAPRLDDWSAIRSLVIPVIPRVRPQPQGAPAPLRRILPPGISVGFAVDIGPAFMNVTPEQCRLLGVPEADVVAQALANLAARAERLSPSSVTRHAVLDLAFAALQSRASIASVLVLVPDELVRLFGPAPRVLMAPMRDVLCALPDDVDLDFAAWLFDEFASQDPNALGPIGYRLEGGRLSTVTLGHSPSLDRRLLS